MAFLELRDLSKRFGAVVAVDRVNLSVEEGEFFALLGASGCGKTTTLRMLAGLVIPSFGQVVLEGKEITHLPPRARKLGMVFQSYALFPHLSVFENIAFGLRLRHLPKAEIEQRVGEALALVQLIGMGQRFPRQLSGGQQQRIALARAIVVQPRLLLFDEPLSNLDAKLRERMRDEIRSLQKRLGLTAIYVTHDQAEALAMADRIAILHQGHVEQIGRPVDIYERPSNQLVADFIGQINILSGGVESCDGKLVLGTKMGLKVPLPSAVTAAQGSELRVAVRPERIRLGQASAADALGQARGRVENATYYGSQIQFHVAIGNQILLVNAPNLGRPLPQAGEVIGIEIHAEDCVVLPE